MARYGNKPSASAALANGKSKRRIKNGNGGSDTAISNTRRNLCITATALILLCLVTFGIYYYWKTVLRVKRLSEIITVHADFLEHVFIHEKEAALLYAEDPFVDLVKERIKPALDRLAHIRTQTIKYEQMTTKIAGGPTQFMSTAMEELKGIESEYINVMEKGLLIMQFKSEVVRQTQRELAKTVTLSAATLNMDEYKLLIMEEILTPDLNQLEAYKQDKDNYFQKINYTAEAYIQLLRNLSSLYVQLETAQYNYNYSNVLFHLGQATEYEVEETFLELRNLRNIIRKEIETNTTKYNLLLPFRSHLTAKTQEGIQKLQNYETVYKAPYQKLVVEFAKDILITKERVQNLKYQKPKRVEL